MTTFADQPLEEQIAQWRAYVRRRQTIHGPDVEELEGHLRDQLVALTETGLAGDEAFLVAVKRMGSLDALSREFARAHSERLWKQLVIAGDADRPAKTAPTEMIVVLGLAIAAALAVGFAYVRGRWFADGGRMNFVRFSGELAIYYVLIALGGGVVTAFTVMMFSAIDMNPERFIGGWLIPCGAAGAVLIGSWLVEAKQSVIENMAPVLTRLFTPLLTILLLAFLATMAWTGSPINVKREVLIGFDLLLVVVVGLVLYAASARDPQAPPDFFDGLQLLLVVSALVVDGVTLAAIAARISAFGFTPNRLAALGENLILLVNLAWSAWLYGCFPRHRGSFADLERWQIAYLPVYSVWAALVVVLFPPLFGYR